MKLIIRAKCVPIRKKFATKVYVIHVKYIEGIMIFDYLPYIAAIVMVFSYIPQIIKILKTKSASDLSFATWCTWIVFMGIMAVHAYIINDMAFLISQGGQVLMLVFILYLMVKYKKR